MATLLRYRNELGLLLAVLLVLGVTVAFGAGYDSRELAVGNLQRLAFDASLLGIFALGAAVVIIAGGIDLSAGAMIAFSATLFASVCLTMGPDPGTAAMIGPDGQPLANAAGEPVLNRSRTDVLGPQVYVAATLVTLAAAVAVGTVHTWLIAAIGLPPFVATLATLVGLRSIGKLLISQVTRAVDNSSSSQISIRDPAFEVIKSGPFVVGTFLVLAVGLWFLLSRTVAGRHLYAVGGNEEAARLSGIRVERTKWLAYCISSVTAAIAGIIYCSYLTMAKPDQLAIGYELNAIAAAVVGGCSLAGGAGTIAGVALGALFLRAVIDAIGKIARSGSSEVEGLIVGLLVVGAAMLTELTRSNRGRRPLFAGSLGWASVVALALTIGLMTALMVAEAKVVKGAAAGVAALLIASAKAVNERRRRST